jgi:hypothetical protein
MWLSIKCCVAGQQFPDRFRGLVERPTASIKTLSSLSINRGMSGMIQDILSSQVAIADEDEDEMCVKVSFEVIL